MSCDLLVMADKYGIAGLVILALFALQLLRVRHDADQQRQWHEDIKANTKATIELTTKLNNMNVCPKN